MMGRFSYQARRAFATPSPSCSGPLAGIKVLDLTRILAGPSCTMTLADFGADVYKIEHPKGGDGTRAWAPFLGGSAVSSYFASLNRNKKSVCVNFQSPQGQRVVRELAQKCDVLVENYVPGVLRKYRLDYESLRSAAPRLVYCSISGFGSEGPYARKPGVDLIAASYTAFLSMTGPKGGEPCRAAVSTIDLMTGLHAEGAILAALLERQRTGCGRKVDANLFSTGVWALTGYALNYLNLGVEATRMGTEHESVVPYKAFESADGYVTVGAINDHQFREFCAIVGVAELSGDKRFLSCKDRAENREALYQILEPIFRQKMTAEWCQLLDGTSLPHAPLNTVAQLFDDPHLKAINMVKEVDYPSIGTVKVIDSAVKFNDYVQDWRPAPTLGQHTREVLKSELGYSDAEIDRLRNAESPTPPTLRLRCRKPKSDKRVKWNEGTVDNESMNKKKSKCCCIYKKPKQRFDESSESESDECENCFGHVEVKKQKQSAKSGCSESSTSASTSQEIPVQPIPPSEITAGST